MLLSNAQDPLALLRPFTTPDHRLRRHATAANKPPPRLPLLFPQNISRQFTLFSAGNFVEQLPHTPDDNDLDCINVEKGDRLELADPLGSIGSEKNGFNSRFDEELRDFSVSHSVEHLAGDVEYGEDDENGENNEKENWDDSENSGSEETFVFDESFGQNNAEEKPVRSSVSVEVKELDELPEQWRRSRLAWLCKELPAQKPALVVRTLNGQRKWASQEDLTYVAVHCLRIRENETAFRVYKYMMQQRRFQFDFSLATKIAEYMGKEKNYVKCREIFSDIINRGLIPNEATFHILIVAYLQNLPARGVLDEACSIFNRMIQLGGYKPRLSLQNSLFKAILSEPAGTSKHYLNQAEFIYHSMIESGFEVHQDVYNGLIQLHSYQDVVDRERIVSLRAEMQSAGFEENKEVLVSILRACSKDGDVDEAERTWTRLLASADRVPSKAYVYKMEVYARIGEPLKSLKLFVDMQEQLGSTSTVAYHKIIQVLCKAQVVELAESLMTEFANSGMKPLMPAFIDLMDMYFNLSMHNNFESTFSWCLRECRPNRTIYNMYLKSLVQDGRINKAEDIFWQMESDCLIGIDAKSCNTVLRGYLNCEDYAKAEKVYHLMRQKKYNIETPLMEELKHWWSLNRKIVKTPISLKLSKEQREILVGLLLGGLKIEADEDKKKHSISFKFSENSDAHSVLKRHIHDQFREWLASTNHADDSDDIPFQFSTISSSCFSFYADQFRPNGGATIPTLVHRWLSPRVLAYWYMYGGYKTSSGDILLKVRGEHKGVERIIDALKAKSLQCKVKQKGRSLWIGILGSNSLRFWELVEPFIIYELRDVLKAVSTSSDQVTKAKGIYRESGSHDRIYSYGDIDDS